MKKFLSIILAVLMVVTMFPLSAFAREQQEKNTVTEQEINYKASNALGDVVANAMNESENEKKFNNNCYIQSVEISELSANVILSAQDDATVIVSIYDEKSNIMVTSGKMNVDSTTEKVTVELAACEMPEYFIVKAFLLNSKNEPLCVNYENREYTKAFEEFFKKTISDFDEEKVINLDYGYESNFAVISDDAKVVEQSESENIITTNDYDNGIYVFENANEEITSLKENDVLYFVYGEGAEDYILTKVGTIENDDGTVTITTAEEFEISDFFSYIKIDSSKAESDTPATFAMSRGFDENSGNEDKTKKYEIEPFSIQFKDGDNPDPDKTVVADKDVNYDITLSCYGSFVENYVKFYYDIKLFGEDSYQFEYTVKASFNFDLKIDAYGTVGVTFYALKDRSMPFLPALDLKATIKLTISLSAHVSATGKLGFEISRGIQRHYDKKNGIDYENSINPEIVPIVEFNGKVNIQFDITPVIEVGFKIFKVFDASVGIEGKLTISLTLIEVTVNGMESFDDKYHYCDLCFDVETEVGLAAYFKIAFNITSDPEKEKIIVQPNLIKISIPIQQWHLSLDEGKWTFEKGECKNYVYKVTFTVVDENNNPLEGVKLTVGSETLTTDSKGTAVGYYFSGAYSCKAEFADYEINKELMYTDPVAFSVFDGTAKVTIHMKKKEPIDSSVFENYLKNTLIPKYGISKNFSYEYTGGESTISQNIPKSAIGLNSAYIADLNSDNFPEMITVRTAHDGVWTMYVELYAYEDNAVVFKECIYETDKFENGAEQLRVYILENNGTLNLCIADRFCTSSGSSIFSKNLKIYAIDSNNSVVLKHNFYYRFSHGTVFYGYNDDSYKVKDAGMETSIGYSTAVMLQNIFAEIGLKEFKYTYSSEEGAYYFDWNNFPTKAQHTKIYEGGTENGIVFNLDYTDLAKRYPVEAHGTCGDNLTWTLYNDGEIVIAGSGKMAEYSNYNNIPWRKYTIKKVTINNGVTTICDDAFSGNDNIENVEMPNTITSIGDYAFFGCNFSNVELPNSLREIGTYAFGKCFNLLSIEIPEGVVSIADHAFSECDKLGDIIIPSSVEKIGESALEGSYITVDENNKYYSNDSYGVLFNKEKTELVQYPIRSDTIEYTIPNSVTFIHNTAFVRSRLKNLIIPNSINSINFYILYSSITSILLPDSIESIGEQLFMWYENLETIYYTGTKSQWNSINGITNTGLSDDVEIIYNYSPASTASVMALSRVSAPVSVSSNGMSETITDAVIGKDYVILVVKDTNAEDLLAAENLLFIDQKTADSETLTFEFNLKDNQTDYTVLFTSLSDTDIPHEHTPGEWEVVKKAEVGIEGLEQQKCTECGEVLDERVIPALGEPITFTPGDVNGDGTVNASDARTALRISAKLETPTDIQTKSADVNSDGRITASDARIILRVSAKLETL